VQVQFGPLTGIEGFVLRADGKERLILSVDLSLCIDGRQVSLLNERRRKSASGAPHYRQRLCGDVGVLGLPRSRSCSRVTHGSTVYSLATVPSRLTYTTLSTCRSPLGMIRPSNRFLLRPSARNFKNLKFSWTDIVPRGSCSISEDGLKYATAFPTGKRGKHGVN
jgi:hypothetical protein